ncbi:MAG: hypothetical protein MI723_09685 [Caulobacterales bacterium]|nr:hypothetical protein [Caulobacterales bacterium]
MPEQIFAASLVLAAGLTGLAFGVSGATVAYIAPAAFQRLHYTEADGLVRKVTKGVLPWVSGMAAVGAVLALTGASIAAAVILATAAGGLVMVRWILNPLPKKPRMIGAKRKLSKQRNLALYVLGIFTLLFPAALVALALGM